MLKAHGEGGSTATDEVAPAADAADEAADADEDAEPAMAEDAPLRDGVFYIWLKIKAYVDELGTKRLHAGFYEVDSLSLYPRLVAMAAKGNRVVEIFEGGVPSRKLAEIGSHFGVDTGRDISDEELLAKIVQSARLY